VAATHSAIDGINLYLDGVPVGGNTGVFGAQEYSGYWRIGEDNIVNWPDGPSQPNFKGLIDEVSIYNRELSAAEIQSIYMAGNLGKCKAALASGTIVLGANSRLEGPGPGSDSVVLGATYPINLLDGCGHGSPACNVASNVVAFEPDLRKRRGQHESGLHL